MYNSSNNRISYKFLCLFIFTIPAQELVTLPYLGSICRIAGMMLAFFYIGDVIQSGWIRKLNTSIYTIIVFFIWCVLSIFWSIDSDYSLHMISTYMQLLVLVVIIWDLAQTPKDRAGLMEAFVLSNAIVATITIINGYFGNYMIDTVRTTAMDLDPNDMALTFAICIPMAYHIAIKGNTNKRFIFYCLIIALFILGILLSGSRTGFVCSIISLLIIPLNQSKNFIKPKIMALILAAILLSQLMFLVPQDSFSRITGIYNQVTAGTMTDRKIIWKYGVIVLKDHPLLGCGINTYAILMKPYLGTEKVAHNIYLNIAVELGYVGLAIFLSIIIQLLINLKNSFVDEKRLYLILLLIWMVGTITLSWQYKKTTWFLLALIASGVFNDQISIKEKEII